MERNRNKPVDNPDERTTRSRPFLVSVVLFLYFESSKSGIALLKIDNTRKHPEHFMDAFYENKIPSGSSRTPGDLGNFLSGRPGS